MDWDIAIVGGGAAGHAAAIAAARQTRGQKSVLLLERAARVGRKLLATGNGTCNLTHMDTGPAAYHGDDPAFVVPFLREWPPDAIRSFFAEIGIPTVADAQGRVYPRGGQAAAVLDALRMEAARRGVTTVCDFEVRAAEHQAPLFWEDTALPAPHPFVVKAGDGRTMRARRLIVATGGPAAPQLGGGDSGHSMLRAWGHPVTRLLPSIVQIATANEFTKSVTGVRVAGELTLSRGESAIRTEAGEILFTDFGLSGPAALQLGGTVSRLLAAGAEDLSIHIDFVPEWTREHLVEWLMKRSVLLHDRTGMDFLSGLLNKRVGQMLYKGALDRKPGLPVGQLGREDAGLLARQICDTRLAVTGVLGWREAQVTAGGVATDGFDPHTCQSRHIPGLYACGEVLDVDGDCGGYNLHWAWASGLTAGRAAARDLED